MLKDKTTQQRKSSVRAVDLKPNFTSRLHTYRDLHAHALFSSLGRLTRKPAAFAITLLVLATSLALACVFYLLVQNFQQLTGSLESSNQISVFLKADLKASTIEKVRHEIEADPGVASVQIITPDQALAEFKANSSFGDTLNDIQENPLPTVLVVLPKNSLEDEETIKTLLQNMQKIAEVDFAQSDMQWIKRLQSIVVLANRSVWVISILFALAVLLIVGNTIRLELQSRIDEVIIAKLVGATDVFIRRPFLYTGFWLGFLASIIAWIIVTMVMLILQQPVQQLSQLYASQFNLVFLGYLDTFCLLLIGSTLGVVGSWWVLNGQLRNIKPE